MICGTPSQLPLQLAVGWVRSPCSRQGARLLMQAIERLALHTLKLQSVRTRTRPRELVGAPLQDVQEFDGFVAINRAALCFAARQRHCACRFPVYMYIHINICTCKSVPTAPATWSRALIDACGLWNIGREKCDVVFRTNVTPRVHHMFDAKVHSRQFIS